MDDMNMQARALELTNVNSRFMTRVYSWMTLGVLVSGIVAWTIGNSPELAMGLQDRGVFGMLFVVQLAIAFGMGFLMKKINAFVATILYLTFAAAMGVTLSSLFLVYTHDSMFQVFGVTAFAFAGLSGVGYFTKKDLGPVGSFCYMGLFGMIGITLLSFFFPSMRSENTSILISIVGLIVFAGLTAYDTQKIKAMGVYAAAQGQDVKKFAIYGAFSLYLDFVNLFISLLRLTGRRR